MSSLRVQLCLRKFRRRQHGKGLKGQGNFPENQSRGRRQGNLRRILPLLLCLSLLLSMTACQSRENPAPTPDQPTASDQQTQDEQPQPDEGEEEAEQPQEEEKTATLYIGMDGEFES